MIRFLYFFFCKLLMLERFVIEEHQRLLLYKSGNFFGILGPGRYHFFNAIGSLSYEIFDTNTLELTSKYVDGLIKHHPDVVEQHFLQVDTSDTQIAILSAEDKAYTIVPPGSRKLFWKTIHALSVEYIDISTQYEIPEEQAHALLRLNSDQLIYQLVPESHVGLLYRDGKYIKTVLAGLYAYWRAGGKIALDVVDTRLQQVEVAGQEILTKDRVTLRLTLTCSYVVTDPVAAKTSVANYADYLYKDAQFGIREAVSAKVLDELLADKDALNKTIFEYVREHAAGIGVEVKTVGVKDIILPGDMRDIMNKVIEAKKLAEANQVKRREETAATRSLLNTAKLMDSNPTLMRLKELETLEKVTEKIGTLNLYGGFDGLLHDVLKLRQDNPPQRHKDVEEK